MGLFSGKCCGIAASKIACGRSPNRGNSRHSAEVGEDPASAILLPPPTRLELPPSLSSLDRTLTSECSSWPQEVHRRRALSRRMKLLNLLGRAFADHDLEG